MVQLFQNARNSRSSVIVATLLVAILATIGLMGCRGNVGLKRYFDSPNSIQLNPIDGVYEVTRVDWTPPFSTFYIVRRVDKKGDEMRVLATIGARFIKGDQIKIAGLSYPARWDLQGDAWIPAGAVHLVKRPK